MHTRFLHRAIAAIAISLFSLGSATAATLTVTTVADPSTGDGQCSLREAITSVNNAANFGDCVASGSYGSVDTINFNIPGAGVHTIALASSLPAIAKPNVTINGYSQPGASPNTNAFGAASNGVLLIEIDATNVGNAADTGALTVNSGGATIKGLVINRYVVNGIAMVNSGGSNAIQGNYIGINPSGTAAMTGPSSQSGIYIRNTTTSGESNNFIGGPNPADRNVVAGNNIFGQIQFVPGSISNNSVLGNFIGTNAAGTASLSIAGCASSAQAGIRVGDGTIGLNIGNVGVTSVGNLISGNCARGISVGGPSVSTLTIDGNFIGTDATGSAALANQGEGIELFGIVDATIRNNVISAAISTAGNGTGIDVNGVTSQTVISNNKIGTDVGGTLNLGNQGSGIVVTSSSNVQMTGNTIAFNGCCQLGGQPGVLINSGTGNKLISNSIFSNTGLGIDLAPIGVNPNTPGGPHAGQPNNGQNYPVINVATVSGGNLNLQGTLNSIPNTQFYVEFFANPACHASGSGQGKTLLTAIFLTTDGSGNASFNFTTPAGSGGNVVTATATSIIAGLQTDTSEFSACRTATGAASATTTTLASSLNPSTFGQSVTFTATVAGSGPTGTVQFFDGTTLIGTGTLSGGAATFTTSSLSVGTHPISAVYSGDANNLTSTSNTVSQVVNAAGPGATTTTLVSSLNPSTVGQAVTFTATVAGSSPTGSVQFRDGATLLGTATLSGGVATFTTSTLTVGTHPIAAVYSGDATNQASTSNTVNQLVNAVGGPAIAPIPTLGEWALVLLTLLMMAAGAIVRARRG